MKEKTYRDLKIMADAINLMALANEIFAKRHLLTEIARRFHGMNPKIICYIIAHGSAEPCERSTTIIQIWYTQ